MINVQFTQFMNKIMRYPNDSIHKAKKNAVHLGFLMKSNTNVVVMLSACVSQEKL